MTAYLPSAGTTDLKQFWRSLLSLASGGSNATGSVTLTVSAASTTVTDQNCAAGSVIKLVPTTANAAGALATTYVPPATVLNGSFVIQHASNAESDRTFSYAIQG